MKYLLFDSNIVIDYIAAESEIFFLISRSLGEALFADAMVGELMQSGYDRNLERYGLSKVHVPVDDLVQARENSQRGKLSLQDWICLLTAKRHGYCCVTNDTALLKRCKAEDIPTIRGHRLILDLCAKGAVTIERARAIGLTIFDNNHYKKASVVENFQQALDELERNLPPDSDGE